MTKKQKQNGELGECMREVHKYDVMIEALYGEDYQIENELTYETIYRGAIC
jgi:hypothetical protein